MGGTETPPQETDAEESGPASSERLAGCNSLVGLHGHWPDVRGVVFDMGDVLYDATLWRRWLLKLLHRLGYSYSYHEFFEVWDRQYLDEVHRGSRDYRDAFDAFLVGRGLSRGLVDEIVAASQTRKREIAATLRPLPGVRSTLTALLARGVPMAVLSDSESPGHELRRRLERLGIGHCFQAVISSFDLSATKPAAVTYQAAAGSLGLPLCQTAFVGHDADELDGAAAVAMPTIAFNYEGTVRASAHLRRFEQLLNLLSVDLALARAG